MQSDQWKLRSMVRGLYEAHPFPSVGYLSALLQRVRWEERPTLNFQAGYALSHGSLAGAPSKPKILVVGCGTFEPVVVALANPQAEILAVDLSQASLRKLGWQARARGLSGQIRTWAGDLAEIPEHFGNFDLIVATGVLHHLPDPLTGLRALVARTGERGVFRMMVYSFWGRALLYSAKGLAQQLGITKPAEFRRMIESLPADHPYKIYFHLYTDAATDGGLTDGFLHPCDKPFRALDLREWLAAAGLELSAFLHSPETSWERLAEEELTGELEENFRFLARRRGLTPLPAGETYEWNQALPPRGTLYSRRLGRELCFDTKISPAILQSSRVEELCRAGYLLRRGPDA